jgi:thiol-disulfide isomerase/thioredoxin
MSYQATYQESSLERAEIDASRGFMVVEFGANWCGHCQAAQPAIREALADHPGLAHFKIEDGPGRLLGRSFRAMDRNSHAWCALPGLRKSARRCARCMPDERQGWSLLSPWRCR